MPEQTGTQFISKNKLREIFEDAKAKGLEPKNVFKSLAKNEKIEIEGYNARFDPIEAATNIPESAKELGKSLVHLFTTNPLQTIKGISGIALGALEKAVPGTQSHEQAFDVLADAMVERYGSKDKILNTIEKDPVGFAADLSTVLTGVGGVVKGAATAAGKSAIISTRAATRLAETAKTLSRVGNTIDPINIAASTARVPFSTIKKANESIGIDKVIREFDVDAKMKDALQLTPSQKINITRKTYTDKIGERLAKWGVSGTLEEMSQQLGEIGNKSRQALDQRLASVSDVFKPKGKALEKTLDQLYELRKPEIFTAQQFKDLRKRIVQLQVKLENTGLSLSEMNEVKRMVDNVANEKIFKQTGDLKASNIGQNLGSLRKELRGLIEQQAAKKGITDVRELNSQTQFANTVKEAIDKKVLAGAPRKSLSLELAKASTLILGQIKGALYQVIRSPRFQSDLAASIQLLKDGDFQKLAGGVTFARPATSKTRSRLLQQAGKAQINRDALQVVNKVIQRMQKAYPALRGVRITREALQEAEDLNKRLEDQAIRMKEVEIRSLE